MRAKWAAFALAAVLLFYLVTLGWRGVLLVADGRPAPVLLGLSVIVLPVVTGYAVVRELAFGRQTERLARLLAAGGGLPSDDLPRSPSGRVDRPAADAAFRRCRSAVESSPDDWRLWFAVSTAYDAAGDRRRARSAMRRAIALHAGGRRPPGRPGP